MKRSALVLMTVGATLVAACGPLPKPPPHPYYSMTNNGANYNPAEPNAQAQAMSDALYNYIDGWFRGVNPPQIPANLIPNGHDPNITSFTLIPESAIDPNTQWGTRPAESPNINYSNAIGEFPDPHATYYLLPAMLAPFGTEVIIEGQFPHSRYFSIQPSPAFDPKVYRYNGFGSGEVALVDADIDPLPGHTNPFRVGADRTATNRSFRISCTMAMGDPTTLDSSAWTLPQFRQAGNHRYCSGIEFRGPWGDPAWVAQDAAKSGDARGAWDVGTIWMRYYGPDTAYFPNGGVTPPKITYQLPDGRRFYVQTDFSQFAANVNMRGPVASNSPADPGTGSGAGIGWNKQYGIFRAIAEGQCIANGWYLPFGGISGMTPQQYCNALDWGVNDRDEAATGASYLEPHATAGVHINYLLRGMCLNTGKITVISGTMPTFPNTRGGAATMTGGQARYWSITGYSTTYDITKPLSPTNIPGQLLSSVMDDEIVLDANRHYIIVYSRVADRPSNATAANGVTWKEWGPQACEAWTMRWLSVAPDWSFAQAPDQQHLNWNTSWSSPDFNSNLIYKNVRNGAFLGAYQPMVSYVTKTTFQGYGNTGIFGKLPAY